MLKDFSEKHPMGIIGYARASMAGQELDLQLDALRAAGCERVFEDRSVSGMKALRPGLDELLAYVQSGDVVTVYKLDRLGRSITHLITFVNELNRRKADFRSLTEGLDTTTSTGWLLFHLFDSLSNFQRDLLIQRTRTGLKAAATVGGRKGGRPKAVTPEKLVYALEMLADPKIKVVDVAKQIKVSESALYATLATHRDAKIKPFGTGKR